MALSRQKAIVAAADEAVFGVDALAGFSTAQLAAAGRVVSPPTYTATTAAINRTIATGTKGKRPQAVGRTTRAITMTAELVGSDNPTTTPPKWTEDARAAGMQVHTGYVCAVAHDGTPGSPTTAKFWAGEQLFGALTLTSGTWMDAATGGSSTADPAPSIGSPLNAVLFPATSTPTSDDAIPGKMVHIVSSTVDVALVRLDAGQDGRPKSGWKLRVDKTGSGSYAFATLASDMPIGICTHAMRTETPGADIVYSHIVQGTMPVVASEETVVGQLSQTVGEMTACTEWGTIVRPDSEQQVAFSVDDWADPATDPVAGDEFIVYNHLSAKVGAGVVVAFASGTQTVTANMFWGGAPTGATAQVESTGATGTIASPGLVQTRTPSRTLYAIVDGRAHIATGTRSQMQISCTAGEAPSIEFQVEGSGTNPEMIPMPTLNAAVKLPPRWESGFAEFDGKLLQTESMSVSLNNTLTPIPDANSPDGIAGYDLSDRDPTVTFTVVTAGASKLTGGDWEAAMASGDWRVSGFAFIGTNSRVAVAVPRMQVQSAQPGGDQIMNHNVTAWCREIGGDDDLIIHVF